MCKTDTTTHFTYLINIAYLAKHLTKPITNTRRRQSQGPWKELLDAGPTDRPRPPHCLQGAESAVDYLRGPSLVKMVFSWSSVISFPFEYVMRDITSMFVGDDMSVELEMAIIRKANAIKHGWTPCELMDCLCLLYSSEDNFRRI